MKLLSRYVVGAALATLIVSPLTMAQSIEEITVTARKKTENLQDVPISVNAISSDVVERLGIKDIRDVVKMDSSLIFDKGFSPDDTRIVVRGIDNGRGRPVIANVIDGADISSEALNSAGASLLVSPRLIDIERVEIVKGPQVALYGRTAFGGAVQYVTKGASETPEATASIEVAQDGMHEMRFSASGPISDKLGIRFNALSWDFDGFHTNTETGNKVGGGEGSSASIMFDWNPNEKLHIRARLDTVSDENDPPAQAYVPFNSLAKVADAASWCNGGWVHDASCKGYAEVLETAMAWGAHDATYTGYGWQAVFGPWFTWQQSVPTLAGAWKINCAGPFYIPSVAAPDPVYNTCSPVNTPGFASTGNQINSETGTLYGGRFDDMEHSVYVGALPGGDDLAITQNRNYAHSEGNKGSDMFGHTKDGERLQINLTYDLAVGTFSSITHIADMDVAQQYDIDKRALSWFAQEWNVYGGTKLFSQEFRLQTENDGPFNMAMGALYWHEDTIQTSTGLSIRGMGEQCQLIAIRDARGNLKSVSDLGASSWAGPCGHTDVDIRGFIDDSLANRAPDDTIRDTAHTSLYTLMDYEFNDRLTLTMEARWVDEREKMTAMASMGLADGLAANAGASSVSLCGSHVRCDYTGGIVPLEWPPYSGTYPMVSVPVVIGDTALAFNGGTNQMEPNMWTNANVTPSNPSGMGPTTRQEYLTFAVSDNYIVPKLVLAYEASDDIMIYGSWTESKKPGGFSTLGSGAFGFDPNGDGLPLEVQFDPEIMTVWELGFKSFWNEGALRVNGALFFEDYTDRQVNVQKVIAGTLGSVTDNADGGEAFGFEVDLAWAISDKLTLTGGYTFLDTEYTDFKIYSRSAGEIARDGKCVRIEDYLGVAGEQTCMIDKSGNEFERAPKNAAVFSLNYTDQLKNRDASFFVELNARFTDERWIDNSNDAYVDDAWRFDLNAGIEKGNWDVNFYVHNLLDDDTVLSAGTGPDIGNSDFRFGLVLTLVETEAYPYGPVIYTQKDDAGQYGSGDSSLSIVPAPMIRNMWYANIPDPRQVGMRVTYKF